MDARECVESSLQQSNVADHGKIERRRNRIMYERKLYENWFNQSAINDRRYRWIALASFILSLGVLALYLLQ